jgi:hypothetical protein
MRAAAVIVAPDGKAAVASGFVDPNLAAAAQHKPAPITNQGAHY